MKLRQIILSKHTNVITAKSYVALAKTDDAKKYYKYIVDDYSTSGYYKEASDYVNSH